MSPEDCAEHIIQKYGEVPSSPAVYRAILHYVYQRGYAEGTSEASYRILSIFRGGESGKDVRP